jgi:hypothetical protein
MGQPFLLTGLILDATPSKDDYPRQYEIRTSPDGEHWSNPVASGTGATVTAIHFPPKTITRHLRIAQNGAAKGNFWSINELSVYGTPSPAQK